MLVEDSGPLDAKIMLVAEAPGETEERTGQPFTGSSGQLLKQMLQHSGIDYNSCYVTNVANERPPNNMFKYFYDGKTRNEPSERLLEWQSNLRDKIEKIKPNVVIALGAEALKAITNRKGIKSWRGNVLTYRDIKIIPTYHPAAVMRQYSFHPIVEMDLAKANRESKFPEIREGKYNLLIKPSLQQTLSWLKDCKHSPRVSWDIETVGKHIRCIGLARGSQECPDAIVIPFIKFPSTDMILPSEKNILRIGSVSGEMSSYWNSHDEMLVLRAVAEVMESKFIQKIGQNSISFDAPILLEEFKMEIKNHYLDTMHAFHLMYSELPMGLSFLNTIMLDYNNYWTDKRTDDDMSEWKYCGMDAISTLVLSYKIEHELINANMKSLYRHINNLAIALTRVQERGITIDDDARKKMLIFQKDKLVSIKKEIEAVAGKEFNPNSPKQVKELLYDKLKFPASYKDGKATADEASLKKIMKRYPGETVVRDIVKYRKVSKLINTFLDMNLDSDGKMRTSYNVSGTKSGRISSSKTLWDTGMNLQNIPAGKSKGVENIRNLFVASKVRMIGEAHEQNYKQKIFVKADLEQAEALVVAEILLRHKDSTLYHLHQDKNFDVHSWMATHIFRTHVEEVTKHQRDIGKLANHSGNYGAGPGVLVNKAAKEEIEGIDFNMAKQILAARHKAIPGLKVWWRWVERQLRSTRILTTCFGRKRIFFGRMDEHTFRDAYSFEPQSIVGEVTNRILTTIELNPESKIDLLLQVHDEIDGECYEEDLDCVVEEIKQASMIPIFINAVPLIIPISVEVGPNWRDLVPYEEYKKNGRT